jgi:hypothetical protein
VRSVPRSAVTLVVAGVVFAVAYENGGYGLQARSLCGICVWWGLVVGFGLGLLPRRPVPDRRTWSELCWQVTPSGRSRLRGGRRARRTPSTSSTECLSIWASTCSWSRRPAARRSAAGWTAALSASSRPASSRYSPSCFRICSRVAVWRCTCRARQVVSASRSATGTVWRSSVGLDTRSSSVQLLPVVRPSGGPRPWHRCPVSLRCSTARLRAAALPLLRSAR